MQLYIKLWKPRPDWFALSSQERSELLAHAGPAFAAAAGEAELIGFALDEAERSTRSEYRYFAVWRIHTGSAAARLEAALERIGWSFYFDGVDTLAPGVTAEALLRDMATIRKPLALPSDKPGGIGGFFSKLAQGLGLRSAAAETSVVHHSEPLAPTPGQLASAAPARIQIAEPAPAPAVVFRPAERLEPAPATSTVISVLQPPTGDTLTAVALVDEVVTEPEIVFESARIEIGEGPAPDAAGPSNAGIDVDAYLRRIGYKGSREPTIETLRALHQAHLRSVPFENLDIISGFSIVLDENLFYEKIVARRRGGFCYELNGLFAGLLRALDFNVTLLSANVTSREDETHGPDFDHMLMMVKLEERWLVDVGFGDSFSEPLRIDETGEQYLPEGTYRIYNDASLRSLLRRNDDMSWSEQYLFTLLPRELGDFGNMCDFHQTSPDSHFTHQRICSRMTADGRVSLTDTHLILSSGGKRRVLQLSDPLEHKTMLREYFGIFTAD